LQYVLPLGIKKVEEIGLPLTESLKIVQNVKQSLESAAGNVAEAAFEKLQGTLAKNPGYEKILQIYNLLNGSSLDSDIDCTVFKYCPITGCDVERSFSVLKNVLTERRTNFS
jgi:hypothetical protein